MATINGRRDQGIALTLGASLLWSTSFAATSIGLRYTDPYTLVFLRFAVAGAALGAFLLFSTRAPAVKIILAQPKVWILAAVYAAAFVFQYLGQSMTSASAATVISNLFPIIVPLLAYFVLREGAGIAQAVALGLGLSGLLLFAVPDLGAGQDNLWGDLALASTAVGYAVFIVLSKKWLRGDSVDSSFAITLMLGPLLVVPLLLFATPDTTSFAIGWDGWLAVIWMGTAGSIVPLALYLKGLDMIPASLSGMLLLSELIFGVLLAMALLGEFLDGWRLAGTAAVSAAVLLASMVPGKADRAKRPRDGPPTEAAIRAADGDASSRMAEPDTDRAGSASRDETGASSAASPRTGRIGTPVLFRRTP